ncbi:hypothetical protein [Actinomadura alba]|uniref:hypothetical protein n=1 Tax=Actinomadura alba TaxID=406431 RepID=UPI001C9C0884|nr:hypothetical protein [Actinomadura alba]
MGVRYYYYRAADREAAVARPEYPRAVADRRVTVFDAVETKWDHRVVLGYLIALIRGVPYRPVVESVCLYPPPDGAPRTEEEWAALPDDSPYLGPEIDELPVAVRDALADADDTRLPEVAGRLAEEFWGAAEREDAQMLIKELVSLARRTRENGQMLYCWCAPG